jgi:hypothetical protein
MRDLLLLAQVGPTAKTAQQAWTVVSQSFQWLCIHQDNVAALVHWQILLHVDDIKLCLAHSARWTAITVSVLKQQFREAPISDNLCVFSDCSVKLHGASCPLTGRPKKACTLEHYRQAKRLFVEKKFRSRMSRQLAAADHSSFKQQFMLLGAFRMLRIHGTIASHAARYPSQSLRSRMLRPSPRLAQCLAAAAEDDCWSGSSASKMPCLLVPDNKGELLEAPVLIVQEAKSVLTGFCTSCKEEKAMSAFDKATCRSCLTKRRKNHAVGKDVEHADSWAAAEPVPGSKLFLQTVIRDRVLLMVEGVEQGSKSAAASARALLPKLCAYLTESISMAPAEASSGSKQCKSCKRSMDPSNFAQGKASCRLCLKRKRATYQNKKAAKRALLGISGEALSAISALSARLSIAFEQVVEVVESSSSAAACRAVNVLTIRLQTHRSESR